MQKDPLFHFNLKDGTHVAVYRSDGETFEFHLTRLNSERHNFFWDGRKIEESYETRFDKWQAEAIEKFMELNDSDG
ncbi:MAG: hypothetical protein ACJ75B_19635 [Flavisolibacter sp.]